MSANGVENSKLIISEHEYLHDIEAIRLRLRGGKSFCVYVLCKPDLTPFYVGKGISNRVLQHEAEARTTARHKLV